MFGTSGIRGPIGDTITTDLALDVGRAVGSQTDITTVHIGRDARESGGMLQQAVTAGLREAGADVYDLGITTTPTLARSVPWYDADAGVMITASHNPPQDNGIKLWDATGMAFDTPRRNTVEETIHTNLYTHASWDATGTHHRRNGVTARHQEALVDAVSIPQPLHVVVDIGNGTGQMTAQAFHELGCDVDTLHGQRDGHFPGRPSEPTEENLQGLRHYVADSPADLGVAHDGDADRMMAVDDTGTYLDGDTLLALFATDIATPGSTVAAPVNTSRLVEDALETIGASVTRTKVGDVFVAERTTEEDVVFGGEPSGAWIWPTESLCPDGPLAALKLAELITHTDPLSTRRDQFEDYYLLRDSLEVDQKPRRIKEITDEVQSAYIDVSTLDGVRVDLDDGWFLIRASGTQPLIRLTAEARSPDRTKEILAEARSIVAKTSQ